MGYAKDMNEIPVIDVEALSGWDDAASPPHAVGEIAAACERWGFFQIVGHGVSEELIERVWTETHRFFALPRPKKAQISRSAENPRGYYDRELTKQARDLKEVFDFAAVPNPRLADDHPENRASVDGYNQWPEGLLDFRGTMLEYFRTCETLGLQILGALATSIGTAREALHTHFTGPHTSFIRLNYYPLDDPLEPEAVAAAAAALGDMALHHHTDAGALTVLLQDDVGGLQVEAGGEWMDVRPIPGAFVINAGDMMQVWSNDRFRAALHRVRPTRGRARYSIPFFFNPSYDTDYAPLVAGGAPQYRPINWGEFRRLRTAGDYADYGKEVQIGDYRIGAGPPESGDGPNTANTSGDSA